MTISRTICLGFIAVIAVGTLLLMLPFSTSNGSWSSPIVALFMATSAVCVTGLSVIPDLGNDLSFWGQLTLALLAQIGGLGYMTMTTFLMLLIGRKFDLQQRFAIQESFDRPFLQGSQNLMRSILATTLIFEMTGMFLMLIVFAKDFGFQKGLWFAIFHSVSAFNNAGFGLLSDNFIQYQSSFIINFTVTGLIIFGGIGYQVIIEIYVWLLNKLQRNTKVFSFSLNFKVVVSTTIVLLALGTLTIFFAELNNENTLLTLNLKDKIFAAWFQSVTTRTAGFNTINIGQMTIEGLFLIMILMFIGASPSGTGGGVKTTTLRIISGCTRSVLRGDEEVILYQRKVPPPLILKAVAVIFGSVLTVFLATITISLLESEINALPILFEVISAFATVGLSMGNTVNAASLSYVFSPLSQLIIIAVMYTGRVGVILLMAAIVGDPRPSFVQYPEENLLVG
jgi:trk system potassium uptake protein TrkH